MNLKINLRLFTILIILAALQGALIVNGISKNFTDLQNKSTDILHFSYFSSENFYTEAYEWAEGQIFSPSDHVFGGIVPHHLFVKDKIAAFFKGLEGTDYDTVILIGPNHFSQGQSNIILSQASWDTPYGLLEPDIEFADKLVNSNHAQIEEDPFQSEHSISGLVGFIKKSIPNAEFIPIILKNKTSSDEAFNLAEILYNNSFNKKFLVLSSVDFSHYQTVSVANFHDQKSNNVIQTFNFDKIYDLEIDSRPSIAVLLKYLELKRAQKSKLIFSTNTGILMNKLDEPTTSHNFYYFFEGEKVKEDFLVSDLYFCGKELEGFEKETIINDLKGEEDRFFMGIDNIYWGLDEEISAELPFKEDICKNSGALLIGANAINQNISLYFLPLKIDGENIELMKGQEKEKYLENIGEWAWNAEVKDLF